MSSKTEMQPSSMLRDKKDKKVKSKEDKKVKGKKKSMTELESVPLRIPEKVDCPQTAPPQDVESLTFQEQAQPRAVSDCVAATLIAVLSTPSTDGHPPVTVHPADEDQGTPNVSTAIIHIVPADNAKEALQISAPALSSWEDAYQHALNTSILSGRFEDLRIVAFARRGRSGRARGPQTMYVSSTLVRQALMKAHLLFAETPEEGDELPKNAVEDYPYSDDSDLEDEGDTQDLNQRDKSTDDRDTHSTTETGVPPMDANSLDRVHTYSRAEYISGGAAATLTDDFVSVSTSDGDGHIIEDNNHLHASTSRSSNASRPCEKPIFNARRTCLQCDSVPTIIVNDTAFRTLRTLVFYAYTHRIAFAPLRSQGVAPALGDSIDSMPQLPACSPKSMYRLAVKYGNAELQQLARDDLASKLSTKNVLLELFSNFTSRHPEVQNVELDFLLAHLKHADIADRLPSWIGRFARGELKECAGTFERFIHRLACAARSGSA